jgi:hypothetical protein
MEQGDGQNEDEEEEHKESFFLGFEEIEAYRQSEDEI